MTVPEQIAAEHLARRAAEERRANWQCAGLIALWLLGTLAVIAIVVFASVWSGA